LADLPPIKNLSDADLISLYKKSGNQSIIGELYERYTHLVFGVCLKYLKHHEDAKDASIEIFEQLLTKLKSHEVSNFKSWLYSVAKNHCLMQLRKGKNHVELHDDVSEIVESSSELHPSSVNEKEEQLVRLEEAVTQLNDDQRRCVEFFYLQELSYQQIMEKTGFNFKEVKSFIQNGKRNLKIVLSKEHERKTS
jgi:RNA polymerase sigma factor (sigma-70 family)